MCSTLLWRVMIHCWASGWIENFQARKDDSPGTHFRQWKKHPKTNIWNENDASTLPFHFKNSWEKPCKQVHWNSFFMLGRKCEIIPVSHPLSDCVLDSLVCSGTTLCLNDWPRSVDAVVVIVITIIIMILEVAEKQTWARENSVLCRRQTKVRKWGLCLSPFHILKTLLDPSKTWDEKLTERYELLECFWIW